MLKIEFGLENNLNLNWIQLRSKYLKKKNKKLRT